MLEQPNPYFVTSASNKFDPPKFKSHEARQQELKAQWKMEDMDPEGSINRDIQMRQQELAQKLNPTIMP